MKNLLLVLIFSFSYTLLFSQDPNIIWQRTLGGDDDDELWSTQQTTDGGFILGGGSKSNISGDKTENSQGGNDFWVIKLNAIGDIDWQNTIGGNEDDKITSVKQTTDGGYILGGTSNSNISGDKTENSQGGQDYWVIKLNGTGDIIWQKTLGGNQDDRLISISETLDGNFIIGGTSSSGISGDRTKPLNGNKDSWIIKINSFGEIIWQNAFGYGNSQSIQSLSQTLDDGYIFSGTLQTGGSSNDVYWVVKLNSNGFLEWDKLIGGNHSDWFPKIHQTTEGSYILAGASDSDISGDKTENSQGSFDYWILKLDNVGNIIWQNTIGGSSGEQPDSIIESDDGGFLVCGYSSSNISGDKTEDSLGSSDYWVIKINEVGIIEWQNTIGGSHVDARAKAIKTNDGGYLIGGHSNSDISGDKSENSKGGYDFWIAKHSQTLGIDENNFISSIILYPNPVKNNLNIQSSIQPIDFVKIYSLTGQLLKYENVNTDSSIINVSNLASGEYFIQLYSGKKIALKKFLKQ